MTPTDQPADPTVQAVLAAIQQTDVWRFLEYLVAQQASAHAAGHASIANRTNTANVPPAAASALLTNLRQGSPAPAVDKVQADRRKIAAQGQVQKMTAAAVRCPSGRLQPVRLDQNGNPNADDASAAMYRARGYRPRRYAGGVEDTGSAQLGLDLVRQHLPAGSQAIEPMLTEEMLTRLLGRSSLAPQMNLDTRSRSYYQ
jgi:hypothetical protein